MYLSVWPRAKGQNKSERSSVDQNKDRLTKFRKRPPSRRGREKGGGRKGHKSSPELSNSKMGRLNIPRARPWFAWFRDTINRSSWHDISYSGTDRRPTAVGGLNSAQASNHAKPVPRSPGATYSGQLSVRLSPRPFSGEVRCASGRPVAAAGADIVGILHTRLCRRPPACCVSNLPGKVTSCILGLFRSEQSRPCLTCEGDPPSTFFFFRGKKLFCRKWAMGSEEASGLWAWIE